MFEEHKDKYQLKNRYEAVKATVAAMSARLDHSSTGRTSESKVAAAAAKRERTGLPDELSHLAVVDSDIPINATEPVDYTHRDKVPNVEYGIAACVARKVPRSQWNGKKEKAALDSEWNKLRTFPHPDKKGSGVWDEKRVREAATVRDEARKSGEVVHFGRVAELLYEKGAELMETDPDRKMKGRFIH